MSYDEGSGLTPLAKIYHCFSDVYADLAVIAAAGGMKVGELAFATDRLVLYRWDGATLVALNFHCSSGLAVAIPAAADLPNGSLYYETDTTLLKQVQAGAWVTIKPSMITFQKAYKTADETVNNSNVLQNDDQLYLPVLANEAWAFTAVLKFAFNSNADFKIAFTVPAAGAAEYAVISASMAVGAWAQQYVSAPTAISILSPSTYADAFMIVKGVYRGGANAGNLQLQWAQNTAHASDAKVLLGSHILGARMV